MRDASKLRWLLCSAVAGLLACGRSHGPSADSNTNWLERCEHDDDCSEGASCVEHLCQPQQSGSPAVDAGPTPPIDSGAPSPQPSATQGDPLSSAEPPVTDAELPITDAEPPVTDAEPPVTDVDECADGTAQCSALVDCIDLPDGYRCGDCPEGYAGDGEQGCAPRLLSLAVTPGTMTPAFASDVASYTVMVPPLTRTITVDITAAAGAQVVIADSDGQWTLGADGHWTSPELAFGSTELAISVQRSGQPSSAYTLTVVRSGLPQRFSAGAADRIAMDGDTMVLGTNVFDRTGDGWQMVDSLLVPDPGTVAISGDTIVVGSNGSSGSSAYVFTRSGNDWVDTAHLQPTVQGSDDVFGYSVAVSGDTIVVGAPWEDSAATDVDGDAGNDAALDSGAAYIFERNGDSWQQTAYIKASNTGAGDGFGAVVVIDGDSVAISAPQEDSGSPGINGIESDESLVDSGAVYVFVRDGASWTQQAYIKASNPGGPDSVTGEGDQFGGGESPLGPGIALEGDTLVVGAAGEDSGAVTINGDETDDGHTDRGAIYAFTRSAGVWTQQAYIKASRPTDDLGCSVALSGDTLVAGAWQDMRGSVGANSEGDDTIVERSGAAFVFTRKGGSWTQEWILKADEAISDLYLGGHVATNGTAFAVGTVGTEGTVFLFE